MARIARESLALASVAGFDGRMVRVASKDSFVPLGDAARLVLVSEDEIEEAALRLVGRPSRSNRAARER